MSATDSDRELSGAWRDANREEPPPALDDAIRAAARREVGAGPRRRPTPSWWPLAAAAAVAVVAIGIVQLTPPDRVTPEASLSDAPATAPTAPAALKKDSTAPPLTAAERDQATPLPPSKAASKPAVPNAAQEEVGTALNKLRASTAGSEGAAARNVTPSVPARAKGAPESSPPESSPPAASSSPDRYAAGGAAMERKREAGGKPSEPFPAAPPSASPSSMGASALPPAPAAARRETPASPAPSVDGRASPSAPPPSERQLQRSFSARGDVAQQTTNELALKEKGGQVDRTEPDKHAGGGEEGTGAPAGSVAPAPVAKSPATLAAAAKVAEAARSSADSANANAAHPLRPAAEWIALIRKLKQEGRVEEAAKELAAFRRDYRERADSLFPPDLRERSP